MVHLKQQGLALCIDSSYKLYTNILRFLIGRIIYICMNLPKLREFK